MEPFGLDDAGFYPCVCRYQVWVASVLSLLSSPVLGCTER